MFVTMVRRGRYIPTSTKGRHNNPHRCTSSSDVSGRMDGIDASIVTKAEQMIVAHGSGGRAWSLW